MAHRKAGVLFVSWECSCCASDVSDVRPAHAGRCHNFGVREDCSGKVPVFMFTAAKLLSLCLRSGSARAAYVADALDFPVQGKTMSAFRY